WPWTPSPATPRPIRSSTTRRTRRRPRGGPLLQPPGKQADNRAIEARPDVLTYTTGPLPASVDLVGPVSARIFVRTGRRHADLFVRLCDVDKKGVSRNIVDGIRRLSPPTVPA